MTNNDVLVSVIVPIYGTEKYLAACIDSILNQSYHNLQIILVDDQSPDNCPEICDAYAQMDPRVTVIHQKNKGVSGARNAGIDIAEGSYLLFVDSDDELYHDAIEVLLKDAVDYSADIVSASAKVIDEEGKVIREVNDAAYTVYRNESSIILSLQGAHATNSVWAKLFRSDFLQGLRFEEGRNINEDGFFMFQCYFRKPVLVQHNVLVYQYNTRRGSSSRQVFSEKYLSILYFCERKKELITSCYPQYTELLHNMEVRTNLQLLDVLCRTTERKYKELQRQCVNTVRRLYCYHQPVNQHHMLVARLVKYGLYPIYKWAVRLKYYR